MALSDTFIKQSKHSGKAAGDKHSDGGGLFLHVKAAGKYWRMAYRFGGKQKTLALGVYPAVTLAQARKRRDDSKALLAQGVDPGVMKQTQKAIDAFAGESTFEAVAREYHALKKSSWSDRYSDKWLRGLENDLFTQFGRMQIADITPPILLNALRKVEKRGKVVTAHTLGQNAGQVFRYGIQTGRCERNPSHDLRGALTPVMVKHMAAVLEPLRVGEMLRAFDDYAGQPATRAALQLSALLFQRPANIRGMEWAWVDLDNAMLSIPSEAMKRTKAQKLNGRPHLVPLAPQAAAILRELQPLTGHRQHVFPSMRDARRAMSNMTVNAALRRLDFSNQEMTAHGFRAMARTLMVEQIPGINPDVIEAQLAHGKSGPLGAAYDRADFMAQRRTMMQTWADYLDKLRQGADVIQFRTA